jgi:hypothetical protein
MRISVYIYFSYLHREFIVVPTRFTLDGTMFHDETAYANPIDCPPKLLGKQIKSELSRCKKVEKTLKEMSEIWSQRPYIPFHVSAAETIDEFYKFYYPIVIYCKDRKLWIGAAWSQKVDMTPHSVDRNCKDEALGTEVIIVMQKVQQLLGEM